MVQILQEGIASPAAVVAGRSQEDVGGGGGPSLLFCHWLVHRSCNSGVCVGCELLRGGDATWGVQQKDFDAAFLLRFLIL